MMTWIEQNLPHIYTILPELPESIIQTLQMIFIPGVISFIFGIFFGVVLIVTRKGGILQNKFIFSILDKAVNLLRAVPFVILMALLDPVTRAIMGTSIGVDGAYIALVVGTVPFFARQIESVLAEVDYGLIEASQSMGAGPSEIIFRVYLHESIPGITRATSITIISLIGLTAIAGAIGAGGLGDMAIRYGYNRHQSDVIYVTVFLILIIISIIQGIGDYIIKKTTH